MNRVWTGSRRGLWTAASVSRKWLRFSSASNLNFRVSIQKTKSSRKMDTAPSRAHRYASEKFADPWGRRVMVLQDVVVWLVWERVEFAVVGKREIELSPQPPPHAAFFFCQDYCCLVSSFECRLICFVYFIQVCFFACLLFCLLACYLCYKNHTMHNNDNEYF